MRKVQSNQKGFTIVELLVVIVVIAVLAALTIPQLFSFQQRARDLDRKNDLRNLQTYLENHFGDNSYYPTALADLDPTYTTEIPNDPRTGSAYDYTPAPEGCDNDATLCETYTLAATLENENDPDGDENDQYVLDSINQ